MTSTWYNLAKQDVMKDSGGYFDTPWRGVLHTTEGDTYAAARSAYQAGVAPHFTVSFEGGKFQAWQHIPLDRAARALVNLAGGVETNRTRCIQIEIVGHAANSGAFPKPYLDGIGRLMRWIESNTGIQRQAVQFHGPNEGIVLATVNSPARLTAAAWNSFNGWCGHQHVPENNHWDPGAIDINYLLSVDVGVRPMFDPPLHVEMAAARKDIYTDNGVYILDVNGSVFAIPPAVYYQGVNGQSFFGDRKAANLIWPTEFKQITGTDPQPGYKYFIQAQDGAFYGCPWRTS